MAINSDPKAQLLKKVSFSIKQRPDLNLILDRVRNRKERIGIEQELASSFPNESFSGKVHHVEHHLSHLASAHWGSSFSESVSISVDGFGDFSSLVVAQCSNQKITIIGTTCHNIIVKKANRVVNLLFVFVFIFFLLWF